MGLESLGQRLDVELHPPDVIAGVRIARLGERRHGQNGNVLDRRELAGSFGDFALQKAVLILQETWSPPCSAIGF